MTLAAIVLTQDEEAHIGRCLTSLTPVCEQIFVVDSGSTDATCSIAEQHGATVIRHDWSTYASQFNWALKNVPISAEWILRIDADEVLTPGLIEEIASRLATVPEAVMGIEIPRRMTFLRKPIRWGGVFPTFVVRLFRSGAGKCEEQWMDEHIVVDGPTIRFANELIDDNVHSLTRWTDKHNGYSSREAVDNLYRESDTSLGRTGGQLSPAANRKRLLKTGLYERLPIGIRAFAYFLYRYVGRLGVLDGVEGAAFHLLQAFWYRFLVDLKAIEVKRHMSMYGVSMDTAVSDVLGIDVAEMAHGAEVQSD